MKTKKSNAKLNTIHVVSKENTVFIKSDNEVNMWYPINFQWIPVVQLSETMNK